MSKAKDFQQRNSGVAYRQDWETPADLFARLNAEFHFTLDAAANAANAKLPAYFTAEQNSFQQDWGSHVVWLNPPYDGTLSAWVQKARHAADRGATVVCLIPARTDTRWWHAEVEGRAEVRFIKGRIRFVGAPFNAPFPSCLVIFRPASPPVPPETPDIRDATEKAYVDGRRYGYHEALTDYTSLATHEREAIVDGRFPAAAPASPPVPVSPHQHYCVIKDDEHEGNCRCECGATAPNTMGEAEWTEPETRGSTNAH